jgi:hypothetical protein
MFCTFLALVTPTETVTGSILELCIVELCVMINRAKNRLWCVAKYYKDFLLVWPETSSAS